MLDLTLRELMLITCAIETELKSIDEFTKHSNFFKKQKENLLQIQSKITNYLNREYSTILNINNEKESNN